MYLSRLGFRGRWFTCAVVEPSELTGPVLRRGIGRLHAVADKTEYIGRTLGVVGRGVRGAGIPLNTGDGDRLGKHGLAERCTGECGGVKTGEGVERTAFDIRALQRRVHEG